MRFDEFIKIVGNLPVIETEVLLAGIPNSEGIKVQISRWEKAGKLIQLKRGIYVLEAAYRKVEISEYYIASLLERPSYVSLEKAMEYYGLIPEAVPVYTSVTTKRPAKFSTKVGVFNYRRIKQPFFWGYNSIVINGQTAFMAKAEKALLDFIYLNNIKTSFDYLEELRLQNLEKINCAQLISFAKKFDKPGILKSAEIITGYILQNKGKEKQL